MELAGECPVRHGNAGLRKLPCIVIAFVAQGIGARSQHISWRQADQRPCKGRRCAPVLDVGGAIEIVIAKPSDDGMREQDAGLRFASGAPW